MWIAITGMPGSGKTLSMTAIGINLASLLKVPLHANYRLSGTEYTEIKTTNDLVSASGGVVLLDEFWLSMDSRSFKDNVELSTWVMQARKKDLLVFFTTQTIGQVDVRVRRIVDWMIQCEKKRDGVWLNFILFQYGKLGSRFLLSDYTKYYKNYATNDIVSPLKVAATPRQAVGVADGDLITN